MTWTTVTLRKRPFKGQRSLRRSRMDRQRLIFKEKDILKLFAAAVLVVFLSCSLFITFILDIPEYSSDVILVSHASKYRASIMQSSANVRFSSRFSGTTPIANPIPLGVNSKTRNFGNLKLDFLPPNNYTRFVWDFDRELPEYKGTDRNHEFDITDDEVLLYKEYSKSDEDEPNTKCRYPKHMSFNAHVCSTFHELDFMTEVRLGSVELIAEGGFKQVFALKKDQDIPMVFKSKSLYFEPGEGQYVHSQMSQMDMNARVSALVGNHPRMIDSYGFCHLSTLSEHARNGDLENKIDLGNKWCRKRRGAAESEPGNNNLTVTEKLTFALEMAEGVALIHNHAMGIIAHNDIQIGQFLLTEDRHLKFNDFDRSVIMMYDSENQEFCGYGLGAAPGTWRSPEEYREDYLDEAVDIYSLGNNFYFLLTGLGPYPTSCDEEMDLGDLVVQGHKEALLDDRWSNRSLGEGQLSELVSKCWKDNPNQRPSIGEIVSELRSILLRHRQNSTT